MPIKNNPLNVTRPFREQEPKDLVRRMFLIEAIKNIGTEIVQKANPELVTMYEDDFGVVYYELNYEYMLFSAPEHQFEKVFMYIKEMEPKVFMKYFCKTKPINK